MRIQNVFIFLLLAIFAVCAIFLTAMSARVYRDTVRSSDGNNTARIILIIVLVTLIILVGIFAFAYMKGILDI